MALKPTRYEDYVVTNFFMNETGEAGSVVVFDTASTGLGSIVDDVNAKVKLSAVANGSGEIPAGVLMGDVVNKDLTQTHLNQHKRESQVGSKVGVLLRSSEGIETNRVDGSTITPGAPAYFTAGGLFSTTSTNSTRLGTFVSGKDADGYCKIRLNIN